MKLNRFNHLLHSKKEETLCHYDGCKASAHYRAPRNRNLLLDSSPLNLEHYLWFCTTHIRIYNLSWDYYAGMQGDEIVQDQYDDVCWQRPTWPMGQAHGFAKQIKDKFNFSNTIFEANAAQNDCKDATSVRFFSANSPENLALCVFNLSSPVSIDQIKDSYKQNVKKYHPDINDGCKGREEKMKQINQAYHVLKKAFMQPS